MAKVNYMLCCLINAFSFLFFVPVIVVCFVYALVYDVGKFKFDFEVGLESIYNICTITYIIFFLALFIYLLGQLWN